MTAEVAVTFPVVVLALAVVLLAGSVAGAGVACVDGARAAARAVSAGEPTAVALARARAVLDRPARVQLGAASGADGPGGPGGGTGAGLVVVAVSVDVVPAVVPAWTGGASWRVPVTCRARAWREPVA